MATVLATSIPALLRNLGSEGTPQQLFALCALHQLACASPAHAAAIAAAGGIPALVPLLGSRRTKVLAVAATTLGTLAASSSESRQAVAAGGCIPPLVRLLSSSNEVVQEAVAGALLALSYDAFNGRRATPAGARTVGLFANVQEQQAVAALWAGAVSDTHRTVLRSIHAAGAVPTFVALLSNGSGTMQRTAEQKVTEGKSVERIGTTVSE